MEPVTLISTALTAFGAYGQYQAGKDAEKAADKETAENIRRASAEDKAKLAENRARIAASGVQLSGSPSLYLNEMEKENKRQTGWMKRAGDSQADALSSAGKTAAIGSLSKIPGYWTS